MVFDDDFAALGGDFEFAALGGLCEGFEVAVFDDL